MTCCVIALALAMQVIETWRRLKAWLGIVPRVSTSAYGFGTVIAGVLERLRHPMVRYIVFALLAIEGVGAGAWVYAHRFHIANEIAVVVFKTTGFGNGICDADTTTAAGGWRLVKR